MSAIFDNASKVTQGNKLSVMSNSTVSGKRISQRRGPFLYTFDVETNQMYNTSDNYRAIRAEIAQMDYGVNPITTTIPYLTADNGTWLGSAVVSGASQTGRNITIGGFNPSYNGCISDGDFIQFSNNGKVYQAIGDYNSDVLGEATVKLNTPLVTAPVDGSGVIHGTSVVFTLAIDEAKFNMSFTPKSANDNIVSPGNFSFTEIIT